MRALLAVVIALTLATPAMAAPKGVSLQVGQTFRCTAPGGRDPVVIVVGKVDQTGKGKVVSVTLTPEDGSPEFTQIAFKAASVTQGCKAAPGRALSPGFAKAYARWKSNFDAGMGDVFDTSPSIVYRRLQMGPGHE